jgi:hypothetical protein
MVTEYIFITVFVSYVSKIYKLINYLLFVICLKSVSWILIVNDNLLKVAFSKRNFDMLFFINVFSWEFLLNLKRSAIN